MNNIKMETLTHILTKMLGKTIVHADCQTGQLHGGTLGDVKLVTGTAEAADNEKLPYRVVWKTQKKWERHKDPGSWRREYDLYKSELGSLFTDALRWPDCYYAEDTGDTGDEIELWMEYIDGISGLALSGEMYEQAALELGRLQGRLYGEQPDALRNVTNLSGLDYVRNFYEHYRSWHVVYDYIRTEECEIPKHLCQMLIGIDNDAERIFARLETLPVVFCHRDFWVTNIFYTDDGIRLIDWDTTGWGYLGEDIASLVADEADVEHMVEYYNSCVSAYYRGFSEHADISHIADNCVWEIILLLFGYRLVEWYLNAGSPEEKKLHLNTIQKIYEMKG